MTSTTDHYLGIQRVYHEKGQQDLAACQVILKALVDAGTMKNMLFSHEQYAEQL